MPEMRWFRCNNCGNRFQIEVLTPDEIRRARENNERTSAIHCPTCNRTDVRRGYE